MAKGLYVGIDGNAKKATNIYAGVNGVAKKITKGYIKVGNENKLFWGNIILDPDTGEWLYKAENADDFVMRNHMFMLYNLTENSNSSSPYGRIYKLNDGLCYYGLGLLDCPSNYNYVTLVLITLSQYENGGILYFYNRDNIKTIYNNSNIQTINKNNETWYLRYSKIYVSKDVKNSHNEYWEYYNPNNEDGYYPYCFIGDTLNNPLSTNSVSDEETKILEIVNVLFTRIYSNVSSVMPEPNWTNIWYPSPLQVYYQPSTYSYKILNWSSSKENGVRVYKNLEETFTFTGESDFYIVPFWYYDIMTNQYTNIEYRTDYFYIYLFSDHPITGSKNRVVTKATNNAVTYQGTSSVNINSTRAMAIPNKEIYYYLISNNYVATETSTPENYSSLESTSYNNIINFDKTHLTNSTEPVIDELIYLIYFKKDIDEFDSE